MMLYTNLLIITAIIVFIIDLSGVIQSIEQALNKWLHINHGHVPKPFSCSLCMTFWTGLIFLLCIGSFTIFNMGYVCLLSFFTPVIKDILILIKDILTKIGDLIYKTLHLQ